MVSDVEYGHPNKSFLTQRVISMLRKSEIIVSGFHDTCGI